MTRVMHHQLSASHTAATSVHRLWEGCWLMMCTSGSAKVGYQVPAPRRAAEAVPLPPASWTLGLGDLSWWQGHQRQSGCGSRWEARTAFPSRRK